MKIIWEVLRMQQQKGNVNVSQRKNEETIKQNLLTLTKSFIDNDSTKILLKFMAEEN